MEAKPVLSSEDKASRMKTALYSMFVGDALSMPVHWYYNTRYLKRDFGVIRDFQEPKALHPSSIMNVASTGGHGRGDQSGNIIGGVILHDKKKFWGKSNVHYHQGMKAGENTLNLLVTRVLIRSITESGGYNPNKFLEDYVEFMTTPGTHNDTYAESYHRDFFSNYAKGKPPSECAGAEGHDTASMGGFVMLPIIVMAFHKEGLEVTKEKVLEHLRLTHRSKKLDKHAVVFAELFYNLLDGEDLRESCLRAAQKLGVDLPYYMRQDLDDEDAVQQFGMACYIDSSFPALLYLAYKHAEDLEGGLIGNTNAGGENCHRGAVLGAVLGAGAGKLDAIPSRWRDGLHAKSELEREINTFVETILHAGNGQGKL